MAPSNSYILALLTIAFVIGEVSHFLIGVVSQEMARSLHYGDKSCLQHSNSSQRFLEGFRLFPGLWTRMSI